MSNADNWEMTEIVVTILERHLSASSRVRRNVRMPVLKSHSGRTRQCDIVIEEGAEPRMTTSIVEVQERGSRPSVNEFNGWLQKMREVGAQHLICVSRLGFPSSIEEIADSVGPTVRLLTLRQLEEGWPIDPLFTHGSLKLVRYDKLLRIQFHYPHLVPINPNEMGAQPDPHARIFRIPNGTTVSPTDLIDWHLFAHPKNLDELPENIPFILGVNFTGGIEHQPYMSNWILLEGLLIQIRLYIRELALRWEAASYEQRGWGELAWVLRASASVDGEPFEVIVPVQQNAPGEYSMGRPICVGNFNAFISINGAGYRADQYFDSIS